MEVLVVKWETNMTCVINWMAKEPSDTHSRIWTVSDSKIVTLNNNDLMTNTGAKIFSLKYDCTEIKPGEILIPGMDTPYYSGTLGFAYAGTSLIALNTFAFLSNHMTQLRSIGQKKLDLSDVAEIVRYFLKRNCTEITSCDYKLTKVEALLFGYCPYREKYRRFYLKSGVNRDGIFAVEMEEIEEEVISILGSHKEDIYSQIEEYRKNKSGIEHSRAPQKILREIISEQRYSDIGGKLQIGFSIGTNFFIAKLCEPIKIGEPRSTFYAQGVDMSDIPNIKNFTPNYMGIV